MKALLKKSGFLLSVLLGLVLFIFILFQALPNAEEMLTTQRTDAKTKQAIVAELGLDKPLHIQALYYLNDLSPLSCYDTTSAKRVHLTGLSTNTGGLEWWFKLPYLRTSFQSKQPVGAMLFQAFVGTMILALAAMLIALAIGVPLGVLAAMQQGRWIDHGIVGLSAMGISMPSFFSAMLFSWLFGFVWHEYTHLPMTGSLWEIDELGENRLWMWSNMILPALALGIRPLAVFIQLTRNTMVEMLAQDFVRTAKAKGLSQWQATIKHALPNALNPLITSVGGWFSSLLAGSFFTEYIFQWRGLGKVTIEALQQSDFPVVMGAVLFTACVFFILHTITEWLYVWIDPRVRYE
ncbi:MAG: ABC transporter permease [Bacteroidota bacterium]